MVRPKRSEFDPLVLAIKALNDIPNTKFRDPIGPYKTTYELVAYLNEVLVYSDMVTLSRLIGHEQAPRTDRVFTYYFPIS